MELLHTRTFTTRELTSLVAAIDLAMTAMDVLNCTDRDLENVCELKFRLAGDQREPVA